MRKTTDPREHKYLIDREFNSFERGAVEDAPGELLYGHGALSRGFNVNCHKQYIEGRTGSELFGEATRSGFDLRDMFFPESTIRKTPGENRIVIEFARGIIDNGEGGNASGWRYIQWPDGGIDRIVRVWSDSPYWLPKLFFVYIEVDNNSPRAGGQAVLLDKVVIRPEYALPDLTVWHNQLGMWLRVEGGNLYRNDWDMKGEWIPIPILDDGVKLARGRTSFIEERQGGVIYNGAGIFRWTYGKDGNGNVAVDEAYRIDHDYPVNTLLYCKGGYKHVYRYLFAGVRLRKINGERKSRLDGGIAEYETPTSDRGESELGVFMLVNAITENDPAEYEFADVILNVGAFPVTMTHIAVYRTLDINGLDSDDPTGKTFNSPNQFALVKEIPIDEFELNGLIDNVDDVKLRARMRDWYPRTRFHTPLPPCAVAAQIPGFVVCAVEGEGKLYYTDEVADGGYTWGSHAGTQVNEQVKDGIQHIELFRDAVAIFGSHSTWSFQTGVSQWNSVGGVADYADIPSVNVADGNIGCVFPRTVQRLTDGEIVLLTREGGGAAVRAFNGHSYGENLLEDNALGQSRNRNRLRDVRAAVAAYNEGCGYVVWCSLGEEGGDIASYCFRLALRPSQGGGVTEYGGEHWLWPAADAAAACHGYDPAGNKISLVEDARSGKFYRIGVAEVWLDRQDGNGGGHEIETLAALPVIADAYKWQKHLETHIAMRCWRSEYRGIEGFTADGFGIGHKVNLKIYEDGEQIAEASELQDLNRNGDYAYLKKVEARRIQEVISTTTSCYKISQVVVKVQTSDREALPADNVPVEIDHQKEWRDAVIHLSRNLPYSTYNRADGTDMDVAYEGDGSGGVGETDAPTGEPRAAFWVSTRMYRRFDVDVEDFTVSSWIRPHSGSEAVPLFMWADVADDDYTITGMAPHIVWIEYRSGEGGRGEVVCRYDGADVLSCPVAESVWTHIAWRRVLEFAEMPEGSDAGLRARERYTIFVNGEPYSAAGVERTVMNSTDAGDDDCGTFDTGISYQNTWEDTAEEGEEDIGEFIRIGSGPGVDYFDARLTLSGVSDASARTYYNAVRRGGEGWLP